MRLHEIMLLVEAVQTSGAEITPDQMTAAIEAVIQDYLRSGKIKQVRDIGDGLCYSFVEHVLEQLGVQDGQRGVHTVRTEDFESDEWYANIPMLRKMGEPIPRDIPASDLASLIGSASHEWLKLGSLYYDATAPKGVRHSLELPFFADQIAGLRADLASQGRLKVPKKR